MIDIVKENIKTEIKQRGLTVEKVCKILGQDRKFIYRITDRVPLEKIVQIATAIGCRPADLLKGI